MSRCGASRLRPPVRAARPGLWGSRRCPALVLGGLLLLCAAAAQAGSSFSRGQGGTKAFYLLLDDLGYHVGRVFSLESLDPEAKDYDAAKRPAALVVSGEPDAADRPRLRSYVHDRGGVLLWAPPAWGEQGHCGDVKLEGLTIKRRSRLGGATVKHPPLKLRATACLLTVPEGGEALLGDDKEALLVQRPWGKGKLLLLAHDSLLANANLNRDDVVVAVRRWLFDNIQPKARVLFLESRGGGGMGGVVSMLNRGGLGPFLLHGLVWLLVLYWVLVRRFGDPAPVFVETRREFSQHARALGHLYQRRRASVHALRQQYERFLDKLTGTSDTFRPGAQQSVRRRQLRESRQGIAALAATRSGRDADGVESLLAQIEYTLASPGAADNKELQRHIRLSQALAELQRTSAGLPGRETGEKRRGRD